MPLILCPACQEQVSAQAQACPKCGQPIDASAVNPVVQKKVALKKIRDFFVVILIFVILAMGIAWWRGVFGEPNGTDNLFGYLIALAVIFVPIVLLSVAISKNE